MPSSLNSFLCWYTLKNTLSPDLKYLFMLLLFLDILTLRSGSNLLKMDLINFAQSAGAVEYTDCTSAEG